MFILDQLPDIDEFIDGVEALRVAHALGGKTGGHIMINSPMLRGIFPIPQARLTRDEAKDLIERLSKG